MDRGTAKVLEVGRSSAPPFSPSQETNYLRTFEMTSTGIPTSRRGAGIHPKATPVYRTRSNGRTSGNMTSLYDILAKCTVYSSLGRSEFRVNTL